MRNPVDQCPQDKGWKPLRLQLQIIHEVERQTRRQSRGSGHYQQRTVQTVAENMAGFVKKGSQDIPIHNLGCSEKNAIETIINIVSSKINPQEILSIQVVFGPLVSHLKEKSKNIKN